MHVIFPPSQIPTAEGQLKVFLAGSIHLGKAIDWQAEVIYQLAKRDWRGIVLNPRRPAWDETWESSIHNPNFVEQVNWELQGLEIADKIVYYFAPETYAPVSMFEFGLHARSGKVIVCCPEGFWRKGNIDVVCARYGILQVVDLEALVEEILKQN